MKQHGFQRIADIAGDSDRDSALLREMAVEAKEYITSFRWCPPLDAMYLAHGVGGIVAIFLAEFSQEIRGTDDNLWIVVGDLPSAYLVVEPEDDPANALERYCELMEDWIAAVRDSGDLRKVYPVAAAPTAENADLLERRVAFLLAEIIPRITQSKQSGFLGPPSCGSRPPLHGKRHTLGGRSFEGAQTDLRARLRLFF